jgi:hypothetical protein
MSAFREWKTPVTSRVRSRSRISSDEPCIAVSRWPFDHDAG